MINKKIAFVTGANGFVGSHLVEYLLSQGLEVHCLMRKSSSDKWLRGLDVVIHREGIENTEFLHKVFTEHKANYIFHLAGTVKAPDYAGFEAGNVKPTRHILDACIGISSIEKILVTSSIAASHPTTIGNPCKESDERNPLTDYGMSKVAEEDLTQNYMDRLPICIVRPPVVYGERDSEVYLFFKTVKFHLIPLIGFSPKAVSLVYVGDLVRGMYQAVFSDKSIGNTYFLGGNKDENGWYELGSLANKILGGSAISLKIPHFVIQSVAFLYENIAKLGGVSTTFNTQKAREMVSESWSCSSDKAKNDFGYNPSTTIEEGFAKTIDWYKKENWL